MVTPNPNPRLRRPRADKEISATQRAAYSTQWWCRGWASVWSMEGGGWWRQTSLESLSRVPSSTSDAYDGSRCRWVTTTAVRESSHIESLYIQIFQRMASRWHEIGLVVSGVTLAPPKFPLLFTVCDQKRHALACVVAVWCDQSLVNKSGEPPRSRSDTDRCARPDFW